MGPTLKTLKLKIISNGEAPSFSSAEGELDFSKIDFTRIYKSSTTRVVKENGMDYVEPIAYTEEEASKLKMAYITFRYTSTAGSQEASSSNNRSSAEVPTFKVFAPFLNSSIYIDSGNSSYSVSYTHLQYLYFYIQRKVNPEDQWQNIPSYLPNSGSRNLDAYRVSDKNNPNSILSDKKLYSSQGSSSNNGGYYYYIYTYRFIQENPGKFKNNQSCLLYTSQKYDYKKYEPNVVHYYNHVHH